MDDNRSVLVSGEPRTVSADFEGEPVEREDHKVINNTAVVLELLRRTGNRIAANRNAVIFLEDEAKELEETFYDRLDEAGKSISDVHNSVKDNLTGAVTKDKPDSWDSLQQTVVDIKAVNENVQILIDLLKDMGLTAAAWKKVISDVLRAEEDLRLFKVDDKTVPFVDLGVVTKDDITVKLQEKVKGTFGAISAVFQGNPVTGWWFKSGDSGTGMIFCPATNNIFSLFKHATKDTIDIKIILGDDLGDISDITPEEKAFFALLKTTGISSTVWNKIISDITVLQDSVISTDMTPYLWKSSTRELETLADLKSVISRHQSSGLSVTTWNKVKNILWYEDEDQLLPKEQSLISELRDTSLCWDKWKKTVDIVRTLSSLTEIIGTLTTAGLSIQSWNQISEKVEGLKEISSFVQDLKTNNLSKDTWTLAKEVFS